MFACPLIVEEGSRAKLWHLERLMSFGWRFDPGALRSARNLRFLSIHLVVMDEPDGRKLHRMRPEWFTEVLGSVRLLPRLERLELYCNFGYKGVLSAESLPEMERMLSRVAAHPELGCAPLD